MNNPNLKTKKNVKKFVYLRRAILRRATSKKQVQ
ncbi:hypothetical protein COLO4_35578 [Corchorus olitorius]|uniref:Uncharacterized protein n=1 Tax=Corchorus olitorius TaxID=93759 RepID=A0A1R3GF78_9ROSI|nr:hypothetical protein COLO4_35578 [Corchorus olitorius]